MTPQAEQALNQLLDRQAILDCIHRYTRGVDRFDRELVLSAYHADAIDDHGEFVGSPADFVAWAFALHTERQVSHHHLVLNHSCDWQATRPMPRPTTCSLPTTATGR